MPFGYHECARMERRRIQCFVAVVQELPFGRAAKRLGDSLPPFSIAFAGTCARTGRNPSIS